MTPQPRDRDAPARASPRLGAPLIRARRPAGAKKVARFQGRRGPREMTFFNTSTGGHHPAAHLDGSSLQQPQHEAFDGA